MARNFTIIKKGDIVVLPVPSGIAIGKTTSNALYKQEWTTDDAANHFQVEWLTKFYPKTNLSSAFQGSLKFRGTFLNLSKKYQEELETLINSGFDNLDKKFQKRENEKKENEIKKIAEHINSNQNLLFADTEFEYFIMHLFELEFPGLQTEKNNARQEAKDGKDFTGTINYENIGIDISVNVQVKQHQGTANTYGLKQIAKNDTKGIYDKNILVTFGKANLKMRDIAKEKEIILLDNEEIAEMIIANFDNIEDKYKAKLGLISEISTVSW